MQNRSGITRTRLPRHAHDGSRGRKHFQTTTTPARARHPAKRIDTHVTDLCGRTVNPAPQLAVENYPTTDSGAECHADNRAAPASRTLPHLAHGRRVRIV